ncbi:MAG: NAD-dependent epimerase/dehydratase family protein [Devosia sp.]|uniref:NAD-dependent epimerase/dehydratase family protein n=1 Tax=Devosia sp. TaxID=1871048 RepID=UPI001A435582|nr:NAD-dependent epimerase/dehydratase family protein [Devosia sp.]MBL8598255.1 NAD-dependent epimerase/dehydratase family protein [Devosia sp.]
MTDLILVTGASGFVGKWCVVKLLEKGYRVRGTVRSEAKAAQVRETVGALVGAEAMARLDLVQADILDDKGWPEAMAGVAAVMHVATVIRGDEPRDQSLVIRPALEGTERILKATHAAGIKRLIVTSSIATVGYGHGHTTGTRTYDETHFTNLDNMRWTWAYCIGKTKAERLAWSLAKDFGLDMTTIHPGAIIGPALDEDASISVGMVGGLLDNSTPALPSNGFSIVDVRDVADMHVAALEKPESIGQRYLATAEYMPFPEVGRVVQELYPDRKIVNRAAPDWAIRLVAMFGGPARQIINDIGNVKIFDGRKGEALMGHAYIPARQSIKDTAEAYIRFGLKLKIS